MTDAGFILLADQREQIIDHARREAPYECCGLVSANDAGVAVTVHEMRNILHSKVTFEMDPEEQLAVMTELKDSDVLHLAAIYHSHPRNAAYPSAIDLNLGGYGDLLHLIVSLADEEPDLRAFRIRDGGCEEASLLVVA